MSGLVAFFIGCGIVAVVFVASSLLGPWLDGGDVRPGRGQRLVIDQPSPVQDEPPPPPPPNRCC